MKLFFKNLFTLFLILASLEALALPPSTPQYLLNQQVQSNANRPNVKNNIHSEATIPVVDMAAIEKIKQGAWKEWNVSHKTNLSFEEWDDRFSKGELKSNE